MNFWTTHQLIVNHQHHPTLPLIYLHLPTHHQTIPDRQLPTTRPPITQLQITIAGIGATTPLGTTQRTPIEAVIHPTVKAILETTIAKAMLDLALQHTTTPDRAGKHYIIAEYLAI